MGKDRKLNLLYCFAQGLYWMSYGVAVSFSAVFLQGIGYNNTELGLILSFGHILGFILSNFLGGLIDKRKTMTATSTAMVVLTINLFVVLFNTTITEPSIIIYFTYPIYVALSVTINSLIIKIWADFEHQGRHLVFSYARAFGSLTFVLLTTFLGKIVMSFGISILPRIAVAIITLQLLTIILLKREYTTESQSSVGKENQSALPSNNGGSVFSFLIHNKSFFILLIGLSVMFISHYITGSFLINVVTNIGGDTASLGYINGFMALLEVPVIIIYTSLHKKMPTKTIMKISILFFVLKAIGLSLAPSMPVLFLAYLLHIPSYALFIPTIVDYVREEIPYEDSAKGQSLASSVTTLGSVFAGFIGGRLYDVVGVNKTTLIAVFISLAGILISFIGLDYKRRNE